ncbi:MAG: WYL domain-containing protein [Bacteroidia bacterium]
MGQEPEDRTKIRLLRVMRALLERPFGYTKKELAERYSVSPDTIGHDLEAFQNAGFVIKYDKRYRYAFVEDKPLKALKNLLHFSEEELAILDQAIDQVSDHTRMREQLKRKLAALYDYHRLGHSYLRKPYLNKVDALQQAQNEKRRVILVDYHSSNSNVISDRIVEPFHVSPPDDMVHTYDLEKMDLRHFQISRIKRVKLLDEPWEHEGKHNVMPTDTFRIVDGNQVMVHLRIKVGAYNDLIERYPTAKGYIVEANEAEMFDFQAMVNHKFLGLINFILGNYHQGIEVLEPDSLITRLREEVKRMNF